LPTLDAEQRIPSNVIVEVEASPGPDYAEPVLRPSAEDWSAALESQFGLRSAEGQATSVPDLRSDSERMAILEDRLAYYEHFDSLIKDNISRSAALFQELFTEREKSRSVVNDAEALMTAVSAEAERRVTAERDHMQHILMSLMDEATFLQQRSDALVQRVAEAITEMTAFRDEDDEPVSGA
jgi:hypothetical protein